MSNISNIFGGTNGALGPSRATWDPILQTGDTGLATSLGDTQGISFIDQTEKAGLTSDQKGSQPYNQVTTGELIEVTGNLTNTTSEIIAIVLQGATAHNAGADGISRDSNIGQDDLSIALPLSLTRVIAGVNSTDPDDEVIFPVAAPQTEAEWTFDVSTQRILGFKFRCYSSPNYVDAVTGKEKFWFTRLALNSGAVIFVT